MKIEIQNLCKTIKKVPILQDITVTFESGKIYGLKGKNGSGNACHIGADYSKQRND